MVTRMAATIRLDAFPDRVLHGEVEKVNEYPAPSSFFTGNVKEYETTVRIFLNESGKPNSTGPDQKIARRKIGGPGALARANGNPQGKIPSTGRLAGKPQAEPDGSAGAGPGDSLALKSAPGAAGTDGAEEPAAEPAAKTEAAEAGAVAKPESPERPAENNSQVSLRPGMTAEVKIRVQTIPNVLQIPVQHRWHGGRHYASSTERPAGQRESRDRPTNDDRGDSRPRRAEGGMGGANYRDRVKWPANAQRDQQGDAGDRSGDQAGRRVSA